MPNYKTREEWLNGFIRKARPIFGSRGSDLPLNIRAAVGFSSKGSRGKRIGECWSSLASADGHFEIFIVPSIADPARVAGILTHELVHAAVGLEAKHGPVFKALATGLGLVGKMTATTEGPDWEAWALPIIERLGPLPHAVLGGGVSNAGPKQSTRLLKVKCSDCGFTFRAAAKWACDAVRCPSEDCPGELVVG